jgi:hypothetical protein
MFGFFRDEYRRHPLAAYALILLLITGLSLDTALITEPPSSSPIPGVPPS